MTTSPSSKRRSRLASTLLLLGLCGVASPLQIGTPPQSRAAAAASSSLTSSSSSSSRGRLDGAGGGAASLSPLFRRRPRGGGAVVPSLTQLSSSVVSDAVAPGDIVREDASPEAEKDDDGGPQLGAWIAIGSASALSGLGPQRIKTMGLDLVVWHKPTAEDAERKRKGRLGKLLSRRRTKDVPIEWSVQADVCPHRLAPLSQGRVDESTGCIECPYHGWQFDADGALTSLPQLEEGRSIESVSARGGNVATYPVHLAGDLIFAFLPSSVHGESFPRSLLPEEQHPYLADDAAAGKKYFVRELPYSADFLAENFMDPSHIPFAHHSLQSVRDDGSPVDMKVVANNFTHVEVSFKDVSRGKKRNGIASFQRPSYYHFRLRKDGEQEYQPALKIFLTPVEAGRSRVIFPAFDIPWLPTWLVHAGSNRFLNTDTWLHDAERVARMRTRTDDGAADGTDGGGKGKERRLLGGLDYVIGSRSDIGAVAFRRWWATYGHADSPPDTFGPASSASLGPRPLTRREQIDPWESHSKQCSECRAALRVVKRGQIAGLAGAALSAAFLRRWSTVGSVAGIAAGIWIHVFLKKCATVIEGNPYPSGVGDRSPAASKD
mmetsp:Transcript_54194/g.162264  ORF Transcript_54194/g.162264 Transcript_54194/m.162264 type:complete len:605 (-) Transcript_54194:467-2281(-)